MSVMAPNPPTVQPFDGLAADYDSSFSRGEIGRVVRARVWRRARAAFGTGDRVLDLGCGTGEDAIRLARDGVNVVATDPSGDMVRIARGKVAAAGLTDRVDVRRLAIEDLTVGSATDLMDLDGVLSDFGPLNCVEDLGGVAEELARRMRPGAKALLCVMGPVVPWEWVWFLGHGQLGKAIRRLRPGGNPWRGITIRYPTIGTLRKAFHESFRVTRLSAIGVFVPPSYAEPWAARHPRLLRRLDRWEQAVETLWPFPWLADHYLIELECR